MRYVFIPRIIREYCLVQYYLTSIKKNVGKSNTILNNAIFNQKIMSEAKCKNYESFSCFINILANV